MEDNIQHRKERGESAYERIKQAIVVGSLEPGSPLVESLLSEFCGVSRTPVREALGRLEQDGLVVRTDRGMAVRARTPEEILDIYEVRISLEGAAARIAADRHTQLDQFRLERELALGEALASESSGESLVTINREFHRSIWLASHNQALIDLLDRLNLHLLRYPATTLTAPGRWAEAIVQHRQLVEAIVERDGAQAQKLAEHHFTIARDLRLARSVEDDGRVPRPG